MCDSLVALGSATAGGGTLFAKNSDRERNEAPVLEAHPARPALVGRRRRLTYIEIDDEAASQACILSRPFWMWGAEMGANEHGVVIGNQAMHALTPASRRRALTGMDLVRLGLERSASAAEAVQVIVTLLERHGQGGNCGHRNRFYYQNGFVLADPRDAYVVETVGRDWIVEKVDGWRTLSNAYSISGGAEAMSAGLRARARDEAWADADGRLDVAGRLIDPARDDGTFGRGRCARSSALLASQAAAIDVAALMAILRDHGEEAQGDPDWSPRKTLRRTICMHAAQGARRSQTVASMISDLSAPQPVHWVTATAAPCLSLFKPVVVGLPIPSHGPAPSDRFDGESLWWAHERLHRAALHDFPAVHALIAEERDALEAGFRARIADAQPQGGAALTRAIEACWSDAGVAEAHWTARVRRAGRPASSAIGRRAAISWSRLSRAASLPTG